jgi:hypothetical protein
MSHDNFELRIANCGARDKSDFRHRHFRAVLKQPHSRRWRDHWTTRKFAKRLDCGAFTGAFPPFRPPPERTIVPAFFTGAPKKFQLRLVQPAALLAF